MIIGLGGDDTIHGNGGSDLICGDGGNDLLYADNGTVRISGGPGDDRVFGGPGNDVLLGDSGNDQLFGGAGNDVVTAGDGDDSVDGGAGNDFLSGGGGFDVVFYLGSPTGVQVSLAAGTAIGDGSDRLSGFEGVFGSMFNDVLQGDAGPTNILVGGPGNDTLIGGDGPASNCTAPGSCFDYLAGGDGNDVLSGGPGTDFASFTDSLSPVNVDLSTGSATGQGTDLLRGIDGIDGSLGSDRMRGDGNDNFFIGEGGNDLIDGGGHVSGDAAFYLFAPGPVAVSVASGTSSGADGSDVLRHIQFLAGSAFNDSLIGDTQNNVILGLSGNDFLDGQAGFDSLDGGPGTDTCKNGERVSNCEVLSALAVRATQVTGELVRVQEVVSGLDAASILTHPRK